MSVRLYLFIRGSQPYYSCTFISREFCAREFVEVFIFFENRLNLKKRPCLKTFSFVNLKQSTCCITEKGVEGKAGRI